MGKLFQVTKNNWPGVMGAIMIQGQGQWFWLLNSLLMAELVNGLHLPLRTMGGISFLTGC